MRRWLYVSGNRFTAAVCVDENEIIRDGPPIVRSHWIGAPLAELMRAWRVRSTLELRS